MREGLFSSLCIASVSLELGIVLFLLFLYIGELLSSFLNFFLFVWFLLFYSVLWILYPLFCYVQLLLLMNYVSCRRKEKQEIFIANYKALLFSDVYPNLLFLLTFIVKFAITIYNSFSLSIVDIHCIPLCMLC